MFPVAIADPSVNFDDPQGNEPGTPGIVMGRGLNRSATQSGVGSGIRDPWGLRKFMFVQNGDGSAWTKYDAVRQECVNDFGTEGTLLTGDANSSGAKFIDDSDHGAAANFTDTTNYWGYKWLAATTTAGTDYQGGVLGNTTALFELVAEAPAAVGAVTYGIYKPWRMTKITKDTDALVWGIAQSAVPAGDFGWMQVWGFGMALLQNSTNSIALAYGEALAISTGTAGALMGLTTGTDDSNRCGVALFTSTDTTGFYAPIFMQNMVGGW